MKPILFNAEMVRAILEGRKTVTRRAVKKFPDTKGLRIYKTACGEFYVEVNGMPTDFQLHPPCVPGDTLYVRETWAEWEGGYTYKADSSPSYPHAFVDRWRPSIHMPQKAARIFLRVTDVRVERLKEIDGAGAEAEGVIEINNPMLREDKATYDAYGRRMFAAIWEGTVGESGHALYGWAANPWVWVIEFERCERPEEG